MKLKKAYPWNVLVLPAASEVGLEICRALGGCKEVVLHGANQPGPSVADFHFKKRHELPRIDDPQCLSALQGLIERQNIDAIFPAYDDVLVWLATHADQLNAAIIAPDMETNRICRSKKLTYQKLASIVPVPHVVDLATDAITSSVFVKPECGQGSQRARRVDNRQELDRCLADEPDLIVMEYLPGREYTVDCFSQRGRGILFAAARERIQTKSGIATLTQSVDLPFIDDWAEKISSALNLHGAWFFQIKQDKNGQSKLLEVAPRIAGSMALSRAMGPNFPLLSLYEAAGHHIDIDATPDNTLMVGRSLDVRYHSNKPIDALYIDLDDTLILRGEVNTKLAALIFQCHNQGIPVNLVTRHRKNIVTTLAQHRLTGLFNRILHMHDDTVAKSKYIRERNAVFIDDSFRERAEVARSSGIRCYDAAGALCLLDDRV